MKTVQFTKFQQTLQKFLMKRLEGSIPSSLKLVFSVLFGSSSKRKPSIFSSFVSSFVLSIVYWISLLACLFILMIFTGKRVLAQTSEPTVKTTTEATLELIVEPILGMSLNLDRMLNGISRAREEKIRLKESLEESLATLEKKKLVSSPPLFQTQEVNPYRLLSEKFSYFYTSKGLFFEIDEEAYGLSLDQLELDLESYRIYSPQKEKFILEYSLLQNLRIERESAQKIHPNLNHVQLAYYNHRLFRIERDFILTLTEIDRIQKNYIRRFGNYKLVIQGLTSHLIWKIGTMEIQLSITREAFRNLGHILDIDSSKKSAVLVVVRDQSTLLKAQKYRNKTQGDLLIRLKQTVDEKLDQLKKILIQNRRSNQKARQRIQIVDPGID